MKFPAAVLMIPLAIWTTANAAVDHARGWIAFTIPGGRDTVACEFTADLSPVEGVTSVRIWKRGDEGRLLFEFRSEPGEHLLEAVSVDQLAPRAGDLLFIRWSRGATSACLTIIGFNRERKLERLFERSCEGGYEVLDVRGDGAKQIVETVQGIAAKKFTTNIYQYDANGKISLVESRSTRRSHVFALRED